MDQSSRRYLINSDGSGLIALDELDSSLANLWGHPRLSPDGLYLAYISRVGEEPLRFTLSKPDGSEPLDLGAVPDDFRNFDFWVEEGCLAIITAPSTPPGPEEEVTISKRCLNHPEPEVITVIKFPGLRPGFLAHTYRLSPQGNTLLAYGKDVNGGTSLYAQELGNTEPLRLLFSHENEYSRDSARWQPDGEHIEFVFKQPAAGDMFLTTFFVVNHNGENLETRLTITTTFGFVSGDWSPDGREFAFFPGMPDHTPETSGIYVLDLENGTWQQILSEFYLEPILAWPGELP